MLAKNFANGSYFVLYKNFTEFTTVQATLHEVVGGPIGIRDIHSVRHRCGIVYTYLCTYEKEVAENFLSVTCIGEIGENFLLMKISAYKV